MRVVPFLSCLLVVSTACKKEQKPAAPAPAPGTLPAATTLPAAATIKGKIVEKIDAASYSYLRLATAQGEAWAAVPRSPVAAGEEVAIDVSMPMDGFESKTLNRKFDHIVFGTLSAAEGPAPAAPTSALPPALMRPPHPEVGAGAAAGADIKVPKADGADGRTISELFAGKAGLKEKRVAVRGKVMKSANGILGKNWLHLRDGTGSADAKDNDIAVTTTDTASIGDVILVKGVVRTDKDYGAGYTYPVIIEDAKVSK